MADTARAEDQGPKEGSSKWRVSIGAALTAADVRVIESEVSVPEQVFIDDLNVTVSDEINIRGSALSGSVGYRILPILELTAHGGLISSEVQTEFRVTGILDGPFEILNGPIDVTTDGGREVDGYTFGLGAGGGLPLAKVRGRGLAVVSGFQVSWNSLDNGAVNTTATRTSIGLAYPADASAEGQVIYTAGASYNWLQREVDQTAVLGGTEVGLQVVQEYQEPWNLDAAVKIPLNKQAAVSLGASHSMSGATSFLMSLSFRP